MTMTTTSLLPCNMLLLLVAIATFSSSSPSSLISVESFSVRPSPPTKTAPAAVATSSSSSLPFLKSNVALCMSTTETTDALANLDNGDNQEDTEDDDDDDDDDDEEEWIEEEFELLTESDFYNTEWKIGTVMDAKSTSIDSTWVRLSTTEDGSNKATWGNKDRIIASGKWAIDVPSQFFSISRESFGGWFGKQIWAGTLEDYYYMEGTVRGWSPISPAQVIGQWQGVRLGVGEEERGVAPWFMTEEDETETEEGVSEDETNEEEKFEE